MAKIDTNPKPQVKIKRKRLKKQQIKQDSFVTYSLKASEWAKHHFNQIAIGLAILVVMVAFFLFTSHARKNAGLEAEAMFGTALELYRQGDLETAKTTFTEVADQYSRVQAGVISLYFKGECNLKLSNYSEALAAYEAYIRQSGKFPLFKEAAIIGKALAMEGDGNVREAAMLLENLLKEMDEDDPRYLTVAFQTGMFYSKTPDQQLQAKQFFKLVSEKATGRIKEQAEVALTILDNTE